MRFCYSFLVGRGDERKGLVIPPRRNPFRQEIKEMPPEVIKAAQEKKAAKKQKERGKKAAATRRKNLGPAKQMSDVETDPQLQKIRRSNSSSGPRYPQGQGVLHDADINLLVGRSIKDIEVLSNGAVNICLSNGSVFTLFLGFGFEGSIQVTLEKGDDMPKKETVTRDIPGYNPDDSEMNWGYPLYVEESHSNPLVKGQKIVRAEAFSGWHQFEKYLKTVVLDFEEGERMEIHCTPSDDSPPALRLGTPKTPPAPWRPRGLALDVLSALEKSKKEMTAKELGNVLGRTASNVYGPLHKLVESGRVKKEGKHYRKA